GAGRRRQHPQLGCHRHQLQVVVGEVAGIDRDVGGVGQQLEQLVGQPGVPRHQRRMLGAGQPLAQGYHRFHAGAPRGLREGDRAVQRVWMVWRVEVQPVHAFHRSRNLLYVKHIRDDDFGAQVPQPGAAGILTVHHDPRGDAPVQQLSGDGAADLARGAGDQNAITHWNTLSDLRGGSREGRSQPTTIAEPSAMPAQTSVLTLRPSRNAGLTTPRTRPARCTGSCSTTLCATAIECRIASAGSPVSAEAPSPPEYTDAKMLPAMATPRVPPSSRVVSLTADPAPALSADSDPMIASVAGDTVSPRPPPSNSISTPIWP